MRPPWRRSQRPAPAGPAEQRGLGQRLGLERGRRERGGADQAGPGRLAGRGVEEVVARRAVRGAPQADVEARRGDRAVGQAQPMDGLAGQRVADVDLERLAVGRTDPQVAAAVDRPPLARAEAGARAGRRRGPCRCRQCRAGARAGGGCCRRRRRRVPPGAREGRAAAWRRGAAASASASGEFGRAAVAVVAGGLERAGQRGIDEPAGALGRPQAGGDRGAQQRRGGRPRAPLRR